MTVLYLDRRAGLGLALALAAGLGTVDASLLGQEGTAQQGALTLDTAETLVGGMPVDALVGHLGMVHA